ncbi:uncharacterized protein PgNI_02449 [Pyricularia grisea]|uniref:Uncharacterized protein n=1 Tax=Pyricularia grisea TaxID=148305 RepID=A0A6P8BLX7_PYRGI|nr:uncharacterized protein PgNI_02449 [Pyricularia grisea]TLD17704.1 hypothetical protein PgNI_02449 [Pyricularia grisea]
MHPAQRPMIDDGASGVILMLDETRLRSGDATAKMHEAKRDATMIPEPASSGSSRRCVVSASGGTIMMRTTKVRFRYFCGMSQQTKTPTPEKRDLHGTQRSHVYLSTPNQNTRHTLRTCRASFSCPTENDALSPPSLSLNIRALSTFSRSFKSNGSFGPYGIRM